MLKTSCVKAMLQAPTLLRCSTNGATCPGMMDTAQPSCFLVGNREPACLPYLLKFVLLTFPQRLIPRTRLTIVPSLITTDRKNFFPRYLLAKLFCYKIRRLSPGHVKALSALFVRIVFPTLSQWMAVFLLDLIVCCVQLPLRSALHLLRPPLRLHLHSHVARSVFNCELPLFKITHPQIF